jgi:ABC-type phosphate/phosphonate transport system substrate-binding protein
MAAANGIIRNIRDNAPSLGVILFAGFIFLAFSARDSTVLKKEQRPEFLNFTVGFYKDGGDRAGSGAYFEALRKELELAFHGHGRVEFKVYGTCEQLCEALRDDSIQIGGELSPIEYTENYDDYGFQPLVGIEYGGQAHYYSVLFVPDGQDKEVGNHKFEQGQDNVGYLKCLLDNYDRYQIAYVNDRSSASGYMYPRSYLLHHGFDQRNCQPLKSGSDIYRRVLDLDTDSGCIAGFVAEFRFKGYQRCDTISDTACDTSHIECRFPGDRYARPIIIDKSDPIPNGVFVISNRFSHDRTRISESGLAALIRIWKTIKEV